LGIALTPESVDKPQIYNCPAGTFPPTTNCPTTTLAAPRQEGLDEDALRQLRQQLQQRLAA
jgi:hypothetical protein